MQFLSKVDWLISNNEFTQLQKIGLHKALMKYRFKLGIDFEYYALLYVKYEIFNNYVLLKRNECSYSINEEVDISVYNDYSLQKSKEDNCEEELELLFNNFNYIDTTDSSFELFFYLEKLLTEKEYTCLVNKLNGIALCKMEDGKKLWSSIKSKIKKEFSNGRNFSYSFC